MYDSTLPYLIHNLKTLGTIVEKAEAHCEGRKIAPEALLNFRLYPDMFAFIRQVQLTTDFARRGAARLAGQPVPSVPDTEKTFAELRERIATTVSYLQSVDKKAMDGADSRNVTFPVGRDKEMTMSGAQYFNGYVLPNFYFHMTTAYNILRHNGVELGKNDFIGRSP